jgi:hypothetical protein
MKTIVLGVDTSECSKHALDWTAKNLCNPGDTLHVVRVEMPFSDCFIRYLNCGAHHLQVYCYPPLESYIGPEFVSVPSETQKDQWKVRKSCDLPSRVSCTRQRSKQTWRAFLRTRRAFPALPLSPTWSPATHGCVFPASPYPL